MISKTATKKSKLNIIVAILLCVLFSGLCVSYAWLTYDTTINSPDFNLAFVNMDATILVDDLGDAIESNDIVVTRLNGVSFTKSLLPGDKVFDEIFIKQREDSKDCYCRVYLKFATVNPILSPELLTWFNSIRTSILTIYDADLSYGWSAADEDGYYYLINKGDSKCRIVDNDDEFTICSEVIFPTTPHYVYEPNSENGSNHYYAGGNEIQYAIEIEVQTIQADYLNYVDNDHNTISGTFTPSQMKTIMNSFMPHTHN